ncbi:FtsX-like permease family protein [Clostridioides sp. ZZV14-6150]|uniref:FtsX-like permease family protein n=1 Tax=unclassified Clostridioides TaxID=2635829 RepID=UPI001D0FD048|nr:ABC transporter permease [Clostridioides sp. ZZV14-6150]MCC0659461.1 ABC transporter permease [Clostridioides sp. ZZV14-6154]MCC0723225.1 ABC transporter permease [Clostridioides sp. ZZV14-6104]MCC0726293.1 ABC transporter permease [Clostridioides sp. ZZV14-6045]MCC0729489.1 ABC transporter permease [Clostridioides sp. ZZV14-6048]MCC0733761.1 ABC transporter permease [Clostridioides sp. ZZV14-6009]MCC0751041.1 ABC transporter permease [Clostridioides sp. ZZV13-5731]WLD27819.1 Bacitracin e
MSLFKIAIKNVKKNFLSYFMYFVSIVFSVFIFFSFKSIEYNEALSLLGRRAKIGINTSSIVIVVFVFLFIYYSNSFFFNRRRQEIGTYSLIGMRKNQIGRIFLYETFLMGIFAILIGISLGFLFSKLMTMILVKLMKEIIGVKMTLSIKALIQTLVIFVVIFVVIGIRNIIVISNKKIVELFKKSPEKYTNKRFIKLKGILGILLIVFSYLMSSSYFIIENIMFSVFILITIIPGTFLFFSSIMSIIIDVAKKKKSFYYKGRNLIAFSELGFKLKNNSRVLAIIAILIATSVTMLGFTISLYYDIDRNINENYKYSYTINAENYLVNKEIDKLLYKYKEDDKIFFDKTIELINRDVNFKLYYKKGGVYRENTVLVDFIKESDFKKLRQYQNSNYEELTSEEHVYYVSDSYKKMFLKNTGTQKIDIYLKEKENMSLFTVQKNILEPEINSQSTFDLIVVEDNVFNRLKSDGKSRLLRLIDIKNEKKEFDMSLRLKNIVDKNMKSTYPFNFTSSIENYNNLIRLSGLMLFIGIFLSVVFLLCTGSIILFKQLSNIYDDKERYIMLKKLGANNQDIEKIISKQLKVVFLLPLIIGTIHNLFAMSIAQKFITRSLFIPIIITLAIYYIGYFIYYFITLKYAQNMIID